MKIRRNGSIDNCKGASDVNNKERTPKGLGPGDVVQFRNRDTGIVNLELKMILRKEGWNDLYDFDDNLNYKKSENDKESEWDIIAVRRPLFKHDCQFCAFDKYYGIIVYERPIY